MRQCNVSTNAQKFSVPVDIQTVHAWQFNMISQYICDIEMGADIQSLEEKIYLCQLWEMIQLQMYLYLFKLAQSVQIYSNIKGIKIQNFKFSDTSLVSHCEHIYVYTLANKVFLYNYLDTYVSLKYNKSIEKRSQAGKEI